MIPFLFALALGVSAELLPVDTLRLDSTVLLGVVVPTQVLYMQGDHNYDGRVTLADVMALVYYTLLDRPLPTNGDTLAIQLRAVAKPIDTTQSPDTAYYLFIPTEGIRR